MHKPSNPDPGPMGESQSPAPPSLAGYYQIGVLSTVVGILVVAALNLATPLGMVIHTMSAAWEHLESGGLKELALRLGILVLITSLASGLALVVTHQLLRPIRRCLEQGLDPAEDESPPMRAAQRRLINMPFIVIPVNMGIWILFPALVFAGGYFLQQVEARPALVLAVRASMVGFISSAIAFFRMEHYGRQQLIPHFFPRGHLTRVSGAAQISIARRISMLYRLGTLVPLAILLVTMATLTLEVEGMQTEVREYASRVFIFVVVLAGWMLVGGGMLNHLVSRSISQPMDQVLAHVARIRQGDYEGRVQVVSNDEIGRLGDASNALLRGLAERETLRRVFGKYVTPEIRDEIMSGRIPLHGERRQATMMFADLRGFTSYVEENQPEEVIAGLRSYFTAMHRAIRAYHGLVLQFVGDQIEAVFGVPVPHPDHPDLAVAAALGMRAALEELNQERARQGKPPFAHGVGIHSGPVLAGNSGSDDQSAYALIGDTVNLASRIEGLTKELGGDILISQGTLVRLAGPPQVEPLEPRLVKGYSRPITIYRVL